MSDNSDNDDDQRDYPRSPIELRVEYQKLNTFFYDYTRNISKGGTFIKTPRPLDVGTEFIFKLTVPRLEEPLLLKGRVRWIVVPADAGRDPSRPDAGMGIQFVYASDGERHQVEETVETLMKEQLGERAFAKLMGRP
ncbi:MAG: TIGR02266 family protein [Deltaproteobacteria bacterium]|nr:TIGR02266 family protein [Deltaproteobacteria bacterium]